jgi:transcription initiation factor IIE alpha subunit
VATHRDRIIEYLKRHPDGRDDDELSEDLDIRPRQTVNQVCRALAADRLVTRTRGTPRTGMARRPKLVNRWIGGG